MSPVSTTVVIGAGIAGVATAHQLATAHGVTDLVIVDPRPPLTLTSDKSTECYRNWWPSESMVGLMNRSIDLIEELSSASGDTIGLSKRGYLFVTAEEETLRRMTDQAAVTSSFGAGEARHHEDGSAYAARRDGVDILGPAALREHFPYVTEEAAGAVHVRRAGWFSAQQLGVFMLEEAMARGSKLVPAEAKRIVVERDRVTGVELGDGSRISCDAVVVAAGPMAKPVAATADVDLPLFSELHLKVAFRDHLGLIPRSAPMVIWSDPQAIDWTNQEREGLSEMGRDDLLGEMPIFCHGRPEGHEGSDWFLALWEYHKEVMEPTWPLPDDEMYPEVVMRGLTTMIPGLAAYRDRLPQSKVDGGYYTKTEDNRPLIGPAGPGGLHIVAGLSGFGVMAAAGAADLASRHIVGADLPSYSTQFLPGRYDDGGHGAADSPLSGQL